MDQITQLVRDYQSAERILVGIATFRLRSDGPLPRVIRFERRFLPVRRTERFIITAIRHPTRVYGDDGRAPTCRRLILVEFVSNILPRTVLRAISRQLAYFSLTPFSPMRN